MSGRERSENGKSGRLVVCVQVPERYKEAETLAERLKAEFTENPQDMKPEDMVLHYAPEGLALVCGKLRMQGDYTSMLSRVHAGKWQHEMLARAAKHKGEPAIRRALDATAGMGEDSLILAAAGYEVTLCEYDPVIAALLKDTLRRAENIPELADIVRRMQVREGDSMQIMRMLPEHMDVIYLDPMFPERQKSGLIKKKFQLLQKLERPCMDEQGLLETALAAKPDKIIVKRPAKGPYLAGRRPEYSITGKSIRYDCITLIR